MNAHEASEKWLLEILELAVSVESTHVELARETHGLSAKINLGVGLHVFPSSLPSHEVSRFYEFLQKETGCLRIIDIDVDRGYGSFTRKLGDRQVNVDIFVHGTHPSKVMDLTLKAN